jgi:hypothetical protein
MFCLRATAYAQFKKANGIGIVKVDAYPKPNDESPKVQGCELQHPVMVRLVGVDLDACVAGHSAMRTDARKHLVDSFPCVSTSLRTSPFLPRWTWGQRDAVLRFEILQNQTHARARLIRRMFGIEIRGCTITRVPKRSVGWRDNLRVGDTIVEINGVVVTARNLLKTLSDSSPTAVRLRLKRHSQEVETIVRPVELSIDRLLPFRCLDASIVDISDDSSTRQERTRWLAALGEDRNLIILTIWRSRPNPWMVGLDLLTKKLKDQGLRSLFVDSGADMARWERAVRDNPTSATHFRDVSLARELTVQEYPCHFVLDRQGVILFRDVATRELPFIVEGLLHTGASSREQGVADS